MKAPPRQWIITTGNRLWIVTPRKLVYKGLLGLGLIALFSWMVLDLSRQVVKQQKTRQQLAEAANLDLRCRLENNQQSERSKKILLTAEHDFTRSAVLSQEINRVLEAPYPTASTLESRLGKPDFQSDGANGAYMLWNQMMWQASADPHPAEAGSPRWQQTVQEILTARFGSDGRLQELVITAYDSGGVTTRRIGRAP